MKGKTGYIDLRRLRMVAAGALGNAPGLLLPRSGVYGIREEFLSVPGVAGAGANPAYLPSGRWDNFIVVAGPLAQGSGPGGLATFIIPAVANDSGQITYGDGVAGTGAFTPAANKDIWFEARFKVNNLGGTNLLNLFVGLAIAPGANTIMQAGGAGFALTDGLGFYAKSGDLVFSFMGSKASALVATASAITLAPDVNLHTFGFYLKGLTALTVYIDDVPYPALVPAGFIATNVPVVPLMPAATLKSSDAGNIQTMTIDYITCIQLS